jgi:hypothetical protein
VGFLSRKKSLSVEKMATLFVRELAIPLYHPAEKLGVELTAAQKTKYEEKSRFYQLAMLLSVLFGLEDANPKFAAVGKTIEVNTAPPDKSASLAFESAIGAAMQDVSQILSPESRQQISWSERWFAGIGVEELHLSAHMAFAAFWIRHYRLLRETISEFTPT